MFIEAEKALAGWPQFLGWAQSLTWRESESETQKWKLQGLISFCKPAPATLHSVRAGPPSAYQPWVIYPQLTPFWCSVSHHIQLFVTPQTVAHQPPLPMELSRQEY